MCNVKKNGTKEPIYKKEIESQIQKTNYGYQGEREGENKLGDQD